MTVLGNVTLTPIRIKRRSRAEAEEEATRLLGLVSHEMGFEREVASRVVFMDRGEVVEAGGPADMPDAPRSERAGDFFGKILHH